MTLYGYYSDKQLNHNCSLYIYKDKDGNEHRLTEVRDELLTGNRLTKYFDDNVCLGEVQEFVRIEKCDIKLHKFT
jgi:hypothetical protein